MLAGFTELAFFKLRKAAAGWRRVCSPYQGCGMGITARRGAQRRRAYAHVPHGGVRCAPGLKGIVQMHLGHPPERESKRRFGHGENAAARGRALQVGRRLW